MVKYKISDISKITQTPAGTIRAYERLKFIESAERLTNGYRIFSDKHILQIKICRFVFREYINKTLRKSSMKIIEASSKGNIVECKQRIEEYITLISLEIQKVNDILDIIQSGDNTGKEKTLYNKSEAAAKIGTTKETVRNWERNGLLNHNFTTY